MIKTPLSTVIGGVFWTPGCTVVGSGNTPTFDQQIQKLFANGEQGFFYDPSDLTTMFQDAASNFLVTGAEQPVGMMLDKSTGLSYGPELIADGNFESGLIGAKTDGNGSVSTWELNTINPISGTQDAKLTVSTAGAFRPALFFNAEAKTIGSVYELSFDYKVVSGNPVIGLMFNGSSTYAVNKALTGTGRFTARYVAAGSGIAEGIYFSTPSPFSLQIDNLSSKRVLGNHAYQTTSSMRPLLAASPQRLDYDTVDDKLITNLPAQLSGCTVIRSVPNAGTQILTGQTIPATYEDNKDHCGLIVINRALTPSETSAIAAEFNKRAGV